MDFCGCILRGELVVCTVNNGSGNYSTLVPSLGLTFPTLPVNGTE